MISKFKNPKLREWDDNLLSDDDPQSDGSFDEEGGEDETPDYEFKESDSDEYEEL